MRKGKLGNEKRKTQGKKTAVEQAEGYGWLGYELGKKKLEGLKEEASHVQTVEEYLKANPGKRVKYPAYMKLGD